MDCVPEKTFDRFFVCTGADFSDIWNKLHNEIVPEMKERCFNCGSHADILFKGLHDHVNSGLGKDIQFPKLYNSFVKEIKATHENHNKRFTGFT
jgi:transcriptional antiterminator